MLSIEECHKRINTIKGTFSGKSSFTAAYLIMNTGIYRAAYLIMNMGIIKIGIEIVWILCLKEKDFRGLKIMIAI